MLLQHLFEEFERCFEEMNTSKQRISDVVAHTNTLYVRHALVRSEFKKMRADVVRHVLDLNEQKQRVSDLSSQVEKLEMRNSAVEQSVAGMSEVLNSKELALRALQSKLESTVTSLKEYQRQSNINLLHLQEVEEAASQVHRNFSHIKARVDSFRSSNEERCSGHRKALQDMAQETATKVSEIGSARNLVKEVTTELSSYLNELRNLEEETRDLERLLSSREYEQQCQRGEYVYRSLYESSLNHRLGSLNASLSSCQTRMAELSMALKQAQDLINNSNMLVANLESEESRLLAARETLISDAAEMQRVLAQHSNRLHALEQEVEVKTAEYEAALARLQRAHTLRAELEHAVAAMRDRTSACTSLLEDIKSTALTIQEAENRNAKLSDQRSTLASENSTWTNKNNTLKKELEHARGALRTLEESKSSLTATVATEAAQSQNLCREVDELNKGITQARLLLGDLKKKFDTEEQERTARFAELQQRHLDEYKEKQSVKVCDLKAALKSEREAVLQSKREQCARALEERAAQLRSGLADVEGLHQRKLTEDARVISLLQAELRSLRNEVCH